MSTNGSFTPAVIPECAYAPRMTRAQVLALRTAGTLNPNCVVVITDGPVIGTAGNTSQTEIELNPVSGTDLGLIARVHTTFSASAWDGLYNIDLGAAGTIFQLTDGWNNKVQDSDTDAPTVHGQFPWHLGSGTLRDNDIDDCILTGWVAAQPGSVFNDNELRDSTVDVTGMTTGRFLSNQMNASTYVSRSTVNQSSGNVMNTADFSDLGSGSLGFSQNTMLTGAISIDAASTAQVTISDNVIGGTGNAVGGGGGYRITVQGKTSATLAIQGNRLFNRRAGAGVGQQELLCVGSGAITFSGNEVSAGQIILDGTGFSDIEGNSMGGAVIDQQAGSSGDLTVTRSNITNASVTIKPTCAGPTVIDQSTMRGGILDMRGPVAGGGRNDFLSTTILDLIVTVAATATAGIKLDGGLYTKGFVNQNRTAGTLSTALVDCETLGTACVINDNGTVDPGQAVNLNRVQLNDSIVTINSLTASRTIPDVMSQVDMIASLMFVSGLGTGGEIKRGRMLKGNITNAGFTLDTFTLDGLTPKTLTANQTDRAGSIAFDNYI